MIGSNYFRYIRDSVGSFAEYSAGIDFIGADDELIGQHLPRLLDALGPIHAYLTTLDIFSESYWPIPNHDRRAWRDCSRQ